MRVSPLVLAVAAIAAPLAAVAPAKPVVGAKVADWSKVVSATAAGGFVMGNPAAKVKLIEFGSLTCPHCRRFDEEAATPLIANYVRSGKVSWEFRSFLLNAYDIPATLTAGCNGAASFFPMMRALYASQPQWVAKMQAIPAERLEQIRKLPRPRQFLVVGQVAGFPQFAAGHGIPAARINSCLANQPAMDQAVQVTADAANTFKVTGTPTFMVNGSTVDYSASASPWAAVQASLDAALRG